LGILAVGLVLIGIPAAFASGLVARIGSTSTRTDQSTSGHIAGFWDGVDAIGSKPLGHGLGTSAGTGQRFQSQVSNVVIPENNYLQVGAELGVIPMLVFVALTVSLLAALRRCSRLRPDPVVAAIWAAGVGLAVGAWFLQTWSDFAVAWTFWGLAGAVLGLVGQANRAATAASLPTRNERPHLQSRSGDERARSGRQAAGAGV
jgi:O-antigen ligase